MELIQDFTGDLGRLTHALKLVDTAFSKSHLIDATLQSIRLLENRPPERRRILLLISETRDQGSESKLRDAVAEAEVNNILIYSMNISRAHAAGQIFPGGLSLDPMALQRNKDPCCRESTFGPHSLHGRATIRVL